VPPTRQCWQQQKREFTCPPTAAMVVFIASLDSSGKLVHTLDLCALT